MVIAAKPSGRLIFFIHEQASILGCVKQIDLIDYHAIVIIDHAISLRGAPGAGV
jgi:hypothetical protein